MNKKYILTQLLFVAAMIGVLALAFVFDRLLRAQIDPNPQTLQVNTTLAWLMPLFDLLIMIAVIGLIWMMISSGEYSRWVSAIFMVVGLVMLYITAMMVVVQFPEKMYILMEYLTIDTYLFHTSGAIAAIGLLSLWFWKPASKQEQVDNEQLAIDSEQ